MLNEDILHGVNFTVKDKENGVELDILREFEKNDKGDFVVTNYKISDIRFFDTEIKPKEKEPDHFGNFSVGEKHYIAGHFFKVVDVKKEFPNGITLPYYVNVKFERLPE